MHTSVLNVKYNSKKIRYILNIRKKMFLHCQNTRNVISDKNENKTEKLIQTKKKINRTRIRNEERKWGEKKEQENRILNNKY